MQNKTMNSNAKSLFNECPLCKQRHFSYLFYINGIKIVKCEQCGFVKQDSRQSENKISEINDAELFLNSNLSHSRTEIEAVRNYLDILGTITTELLLFCSKNHPIINVLRSRNQPYKIVSTYKELEDVATNTQKYGSAIILFKLEKFINPQNILSLIYKSIHLESSILIVLPNLNSISVKIFGSAWTEWREENKSYFNQNTIQHFLLQNGFEKVEIYDDPRKYTIDHILQRTGSLPQTWITNIISSLKNIIPTPIKEKRLPIKSSAMVVLARKRRVSPATLSIIIPLYNEEKTFPVLMELLLNKNLDSINKEIIIIESNSSDKSRELAQYYARNYPEIKLILQEIPQGKGFAVREGFKQATGDIIMIQDADLEYDIQDYEALIEPLISHQAMFVLGTRHGGTLKMRHFESQPLLSFIMNSGQKIFTALLNILYKQNMKDPFTMYKVFYRDAIYGLKFECNRFDFDYELVIKLLRKGYDPYEVPVNYVSRSYKDGKKVRFFPDPLTWIWASFKYRFVSIYKPEVDPENKNFKKV